MAKIDIIIPAYNTEKYLSKCLNSVLNQTFEDYKIIIVDDGSKDKTLEIAKIYHDAFPNLIKLLPLFKNQGAAHARNTGLEVSTGEYVMFLDSDDELMPGVLEEANNIIDKYNPEIINFNMIMNYNGIDVTKAGLRKDVKTANKLISPYDEKSIIHEIRPSVTAKCFKRSSIEPNFPSGLKWEDYAFVVPHLVQTENIYISTMIGYKYNVNLFGTSVTDIFKVPTRILDIFEGTDIINSNIDRQHHKDFAHDLRITKTINCLQRVRDLAFAVNISYIDKVRLANLLVNLITIREGDYKELEWYHEQIKQSLLYRIRMKKIESTLDKELQTYTDERLIKKLILTITDKENNN